MSHPELPSQPLRTTFTEPFLSIASTISSTKSFAKYEGNSHVQPQDEFEEANSSTDTDDVYERELAEEHERQTEEYDCKARLEALFPKPTENTGNVYESYQLSHDDLMVISRFDNDSVYEFNHSSPGPYILPNPSPNRPKPTSNSIGIPATV